MDEVKVTGRISGELSSVLAHDGDSAYEIAVRYGFEGTEEEWLASLKEPAETAAAEANASEVVRKANESIRQEQEQERITAEAERQQNEAARKNSETARSNAELIRTSAETVRAEAEANRGEAENIRAEAEKNRVLAETLRANNESARASAEAAREQAEADRIQKVQNGYFDGDSAYQVAVKNGYKGTEQEWLKSLSGVYLGSGDMPNDCYVQIDPNGDALDLGYIEDEIDRLSEEISDETENRKSEISKETTARDAAIAQERNRAVARENEIEELFTMPTQEAVNKWLDEHPEATTTVQDNSLTINKMVIGTLGYVTPEMFGAVGDGVTDDTNAIQNAVNSGKVVDLVGKVYKFSQTINLHENLTIRNGSIIAENVTNVFELIAPEGTTFENISVENLHIDGTNTCYSGLFIRRCENVIVDNCFIENFYGETDVVSGIHLRECSNSHILNTSIDNVEAKPNGSTGDAIGASRGILFTDTIDSTIEKCVIDNIVSTDDSDGIHIASYLNTDNNIIGGIIIRGNIFRNTGRRAIKLQQSGVAILENQFLSTKTHEYTISCYTSHVDIKGNTFNGQTAIPIIIGSSNTVYSNFVICENKFINGIYSYQGCVVTEQIVKNLQITNNYAKLTDTKYLAYLRGWAENIIIDNNIVENCYYLAYFRKPSNDVLNDSTVNKHITITKNTGSCHWSIAYFEDCNALYDYIVVSQNTFTCLTTQLSQYQVTVRLGDKVYSKYPIIKDNLVKLNGTMFPDVCRISGVLSKRPVEGVNIGDMYFDTESNKFWTCCKRATYDETGTKTADAEWI